jgi:hypothetical protein
MTAAVRVLLVVVAVLGTLWLARGLGPVRDERAGIAAADAREGRPTPERLARAYRLLERSAANSRSSVPDLRLAQLDAFAGRPDRAVRRLVPVVAREPENVEAWRLLSYTARSVDPAVAARARERVRRLSPPVPPPR